MRNQLIRKVELATSAVRLQPWVALAISAG
jgi:hypothetical protein